MALRRPLVNVNGRVKELPIGDTLPGAGGALPWINITLNIPVERGRYEYQQNVVDASVGVSSSINLKLAPADENAFLSYDPEFVPLLMLIARPLTGSFDVLVSFNELYDGRINLQYQVN
jgi:hypothetical protein